MNETPRATFMAVMPGSKAMLLLLLGAGCSPPAFRTTLPLTRLEQAAREAPPDQVELLASPVTLDRFTGLGENERGLLVPVAVRVPQGVSYIAPTVDLREAPGLAGTDIYPTFDRRTVPLVPYGTFFVELLNKTSKRVVVSPQSLRLVARGVTYPAIADSGSLAGRWRRTLDAFEGHRVGMPIITPGVFDLHRELYVLDRPVPIEPGRTWRGYVVFDTGAFTADEYEAFLRSAGQVEVQLVDGPNKRSSQTFLAKSGAADVICLPKTAHIDFMHCEVLVTSSLAAR